MKANKSPLSDKYTQNIPDKNQELSYIFQPCKSNPQNKDETPAQYLRFQYFLRFHQKNSKYIAISTDQNPEQSQSTSVATQTHPIKYKIVIGFDQFPNHPITQQFSMHSELTLEGAIERTFGKTYKRIRDIASSWYLFSPYQNSQTQEKTYFKLLQVPSSYHASQESYAKFSNAYKGLLHQTEIIFVERCFQSSYYLLKSSTNIISFRGLLELRSDCGELVQSFLILRLIEFVAHLETKNVHEQINIDIDAIGMNQAGNFRVCNYSLYFLRDRETSLLTSMHSQDTSYKEECDLQLALRKILTRVITLNKSLSLSNEDLYIKTIENYNLSFANAVFQVLTTEQFTKDNILEILSQEKSASETRTIVTDSFIESIDLKDDIEVLHGSFVKTESDPQSSYQNLSSSKVRSTFASVINSIQNKPKVKKWIKYSLIFMIIAMIVGGAFLTFILINKPLKCDQGQFLNPSNVCRSCPFGCQRCINDEKNQCLSCKGSLFLILEFQEDKTGVCQQECTGKYMGRHVCVKNHDRKQQFE